MNSSIKKAGSIRALLNSDGESLDVTLPLSFVGEAGDLAGCRFFGAQTDGCLVEGDIGDVFSAAGQGSDQKKCHNCGTTDTPSWRRDLTNSVLLCNACGLYLRIHQRQRVFRKLKSGKTRAYHPTTLRGSPEAAEIPLTKVCTNCGTEATPVWRRGANRRVLCNACALFEKNNGRQRSA